MATSPDPKQSKQEHPSTYVVQDRTSQEELTRLDEQDILFTTHMGGVLPEQPDPTKFQHLLDVGCGPGGWLVETAKAYPEIKKLVGIDISSYMIEFAQKRAEQEQVSDRVTFQAGDALRMLEFPKHTFHLVNQRFAMGFLRSWDWPKLLREYQRVAKPGGVIRLTETALPEGNSAAFNKLFEYFVQAGYNAGNFMSPERDSVIRHLPDIMTKHGILQVQTKDYILVYNSDQPEARASFIRDIQRLFRTAGPFIRKWTKVADQYDELYQSMDQDMQKPDFEAKIVLLTAWGHTAKPRTLANS